MAVLLKWQQTWDGSALAWLETWGEDNKLNVVQSVAISLSGTASLSGDLGFAFDVAQSGALPLSGTVALSGNVGIALPFDIAQTAMLAMFGTSTLLVSTGDFGFATQFPLVSPPLIAIDGVVEIGADIEIGLRLALAQTAPVALHGTAAISGQLGTSIQFAPTTLAIAGELLSYVETLDFTIPLVIPFDFDHLFGPDLIGVVATQGDIQSANNAFDVAHVAGPVLNGVVGTSGNIGLGLTKAIVQAAPIAMAGAVMAQGNIQAVDNSFNVAAAPVALAGAVMAQAEIQAIDNSFDVTAGIAITGAAAITADVKIWRPFVLQTTQPIILTGVSAYAGNFGTREPHMIEFPVPVAMAGTMAGVATFEYLPIFHLETAADIQINATLGVAGDVTYSDILPAFCGRAEARPFQQYVNARPFQ